MRKLLLSLLAVSSTASFAVANNNEFQEFDNQVSIGWGQNSTEASYGTAAGAPGNVNSVGNMLTLEGERLFNNGVWVDVVANGQFGAGPSSAPGFKGGVVNPSFTPYSAPSYGLNGKVGYAFPLLNQHLLLTPYALVGINNNSSTAINEIISSAGVVANNGTANTANQFYYSGGFGGRLEYRINHWIELYADQNAVYNWDQTGMPLGIQPQNFISYTSTLGGKFNLAPNFQLGVKGFYTAYDNQAGNFGGAFAQNTSGFGGIVSVGVTY